MPYIKPEQRTSIDELIDKLVPIVDDTTGGMNYAITSLLHKVVLSNIRCYDMLNSLIGVLECAKMEL